MMDRDYLDRVYNRDFDLVPFGDSPDDYYDGFDNQPDMEQVLMLAGMGDPATVLGAFRKVNTCLLNQDDHVRAETIRKVMENED